MSGKIELKPIKALFNMSFFIPDYQRGYRWGKQQVEDLLYDLDEFKNTVGGAGDSQKIYCLQPLVVKKEDGKYSVIDGQQRLTTIKILLSCLGEKNNYSVEYQTRNEREGFLDKIDEQCIERWEDNADFFHMYHAKETINKWLDNKDIDYKNAFFTIVKEKVNFVWYESDDPDPIKVFKAVARAVIHNRRFLDIQTIAEVGLPVGGDPKISDVYECIPIFVNRNAVCDCNPHVRFHLNDFIELQCRAFFHVLISLFLFSDYTTLFRQ